MFDAVHKETGESYYAAAIWDAFEDPHEEKWVCCPDEDHPVIPYLAFKDKNGRFVSSHFKHKKGYDGRCKYTGGGEGKLHRKYKNLLYSIIESDDIDFYVGESTVKLTDFNTHKFMADLTHRWEDPQKKVKVEKEKYTEDKKRRPDLRVPFKNFHPFFGKGLAVEIQISGQKEKEKQERTKDLVNNFWSVIWLHEQHFSNKDSSFGIKVEKIKIKYPFLKTYVKKQIETIDETVDSLNKLKEETNEKIKSLELEMNRKIDSLIKKSTKSCRTCKHGSPHKEKINGEYTRTNDGRIDCWYENNKKNIKGRPKVHESFDTCDRWERSGGNHD